MVPLPPTTAPRHLHGPWTLQDTTRRCVLRWGGALWGALISETTMGILWKMNARPVEPVAVTRDGIGMAAGRGPPPMTRLPAVRRSPQNKGGVGPPLTVLTSDRLHAIAMQGAGVHRMKAAGTLSRVNAVLRMGTAPMASSRMNNGIMGGATEAVLMAGVTETMTTMTTETTVDAADLRREAGLTTRRRDKCVTC